MPVNSIDRALGRRIARLRRRSGLSPHRLAVLSGIDALRLASLERGATRATLEEILRLSCALGVTVRELYRGVDEGAPVSLAVRGR